MTMQHDRKWFRHLPHSVYVATDDDGATLYVGSGIDPIARLRHHLYSPATWAGRDLVVSVAEFPNYWVARMYEAHLIWLLKPRFNRRLERRALASYEAAIEQGATFKPEPQIRRLGEWLNR